MPYNSVAIIRETLNLFFVRHTFIIFILYYHLADKGVVDVLVHIPRRKNRNI